LSDRGIAEAIRITRAFSDRNTITRGKWPTKLLGSQILTMNQFILAIEMLANPASNTVELKAAFTEEIAAADLNDLMDRIESHLGSFCQVKPDNYLSPPTNTATHLAPARRSATVHQSGSVDSELEDTLVAAAASFLNVEASLVGPASSLVALGLTSLKSVALSRKLKGSSIFVSAIDIIQADTVRGIASKCGYDPAPSRSTSDERRWLDDLHRQLKDELVIDDLRLTPEDNPQIICATALQSGMLSQVRPSPLSR
jgi:hypothetical protein